MSGNYTKQVEKNHYSFERYFYRGRWMSYWYQIKEILELERLGSILEVGPGTTLVKDVLKYQKSDVEYKALDLDPALAPDIIGSVTNIPVREESFDCVTAFQVLEHIEFSDFEKALSEMNRVSKKYILISLPHFGPQLTFSLKIPFLNQVQFAHKIPWPKEITFQGQHYWEIGRKGYSATRIRNIMKKHFRIKKEYVPFENQYHRFYVLEKIEQ